MGRYIQSMGAAARMTARAVAKSLPAVATIASTALKIAKKNRTQKAPECKFFDTSPAVINPDIGAATASTNLTLVTQGVASYNRLGSEIRLKNLELGYLIGQTYGHTGPVGVRVIVLQDKARSLVSTAPLASEILELASLGFAGDVLVAPYSKEMPNRFRIMYDKCHNLGVANTLGFTEPQQITVRRTFRIPAKYNKVSWDQTGNAQGDLRGNVLYILVMANSSGDALDPTFNMYCRINFWDN